MLLSFFLGVLLIGALTFGGGYAMISALQQYLVVRHGWLTSEQFSNSVAVGQITPGPLMIMIAFIGYKIGGVLGSVLGTLGLFIPSFITALIVSRYYHRVKASPVVAAALKGVNAVVVGLLAVAAFDLAKDLMGNFISSVIIILGGGILWFYRRIDSTWVILASGLLGALLLR